MNIVTVLGCLLFLLVLVGVLVWRFILHWRRDKELCMGYDVGKHSNGLPSAVSCKAKLSHRQTHTVIEKLDDSNVQAEVGRQGGTIVSMDVCKKHCPGGCQKGCKSNEKEVR